MTKSETLKHPSLFYQVYAEPFMKSLGIIPNQIDFGFIKIKPNLFFRILRKFGVIKNKWQIVGTMTNYNFEETIVILINLLSKEFPETNVEIKNVYHWQENSYCFSATGAIDLYIHFKDDADEADFVVRGDVILENIKSNSSLVLK